MTRDTRHGRYYRQQSNDGDRLWHYGPLRSYRDDPSAPRWRGYAGPVLVGFLLAWCLLW